MAITNTTLASPTYNGNGSTTAFATGFQFIQNADLLVTVTDSSGVETVKVLTTDYTVTGAGNSVGGTVTFLVAPVSGSKVNIQNNVTLDQQTDYVEGGSFSAATHEDALDKLTKISQQLQEQIDRSVKLPIANQSITSQAPSPTAGYVLGVNAGGTSLEWKDPADIALGVTVSAFAETLLDDATASDARTTLGLGTMATQAASNVAITGGSVTGITDIALADGGTGASLADPNADRILFWDDSAGAMTWLAPSGNIAITGTTIDAVSTLDINGLTSIGAAVDGASDTFPIYDSSATANRKVTLNDLITSLTEDTTPDTANDLVITYDNSATQIKKVKLQNLVATGDWVKISSSTASSSSSVDFTGLSSTYRAYVVVLSAITPATNAVGLRMLTSTNNGSSYDTGASDYGYYNGAVAFSGSSITETSTAAAAINISTTIAGSGLSNTAGFGFNGTVYIHNVSNTTDRKIFTWHGGCTYSTPTGATFVGTGSRHSTGDIDAIRFQMSSGNIASGTFTLYGLRA